VRGLSYSECEDWSVLVHSPGDDAAVMAVMLRNADVAGMLRREGGAMIDPHRGTSDFSVALSQSLALADLSTDLDLGTDFRTNGRFWEQMVMPLDFLRRAPGVLLFEIQDDEHGRASRMFPHRDGAVPVVPYVSYAGAG
jgi:hypothetical protein